MTGFELVVGCLIGWGWRKARHVAGHADAAVDATLDAGVDRLRELVVSKLHNDPALAALDAEAATGVDAPQVSDLTKQRVLLSLQAAAAADPEFEAELLQQAERLRQAGGASAFVFGANGVAIGGGQFMQAQTGGVAAVSITGGVNTGGTPNPLNPPMPGTEPA